MKYTLFGKQMKQYDTRTIEYYKVPSVVLMERAALSVVNELKQRNVDLSVCLIVCGSGNNGGDGFAIVRLLWQKGVKVIPVLVGNRANRTDQTKLQMEILEKYQIQVYDEIPDLPYTAVFDCVFGIGLSRDITGNYAEIIQKMNEIDAYKIAVDIPSGISSDNGRVLNIAFKANCTITFAFAKNGMLLYPGAEYAGDVIIREIGIDEHSFHGQTPSGIYYEKEDLKLIPKRNPNSNKGSFGKVLCIAGSRAYSTAAAFSSKAAALCGAGMVKVLTHERNHTILACQAPEVMLDTYKDEIEEEKIAKHFDWASVILIGPGLDTNETSANLMRFVLKNASVPLIVDADGLNLISQMKLRKEDLPKVPMVFTPHVGEAARLLDCKIDDIKNDMIESAQEISRRYGAFCVLKDARSVITMDDDKYAINLSGNSGMATGGSGDVLAGMIAGLAAQKLDLSTAASLGAYLHGVCGDRAKEKKGEYSMLATDIIDAISDVLKEI